MRQLGQQHDRPASGTSAAGTAGATIKAGILTPVGAINPITIDDQGGLELLGNVGEFLVFTDHSGIYHPWLATSWSPNADASVWTFKIRQGVKFNDGTPMTVDDVVYSFQTQCRSEERGQRAVACSAASLAPDGVAEGGRPDGRLPPRRPRTTASWTRCPRTTTT